MHSVIIGDTWGSIFETIYKQPRRLFMSPTDDSFLTAACYEFMLSLTKDELHNPSKNKDAIYSKGVKYLKQWFFYFPEPGAFSSGFSNWCKQDGEVSKFATTNGCLMRHSPILLIGLKNQLPLFTIQTIAEIFCSTTHRSAEAFLETYKHIDIMYKVFTGVATKEDLNLHHDGIKTLAEWQEIASNTKNNFIWSAKDSLGIALSAIYLSQSWDEMMRFFISISGDVDTYAAIAAPLAQKFYGSNLHEKEFERIILKEKTTRAKKLFSIYSLMKKDTLNLKIGK